MPFIQTQVQARIIQYTTNKARRYSYKCRGYILGPPFCIGPRVPLSSVGHLVAEYFFGYILRQQRKSYRLYRDIKSYDSM